MEGIRGEAGENFQNGQDGKEVVGNKCREREVLVTLLTGISTQRKAYWKEWVSMEGDR